MKPSHLDPGGAPRMVDVGDKPVSQRRANAEARVRMQPDVLGALVDAGGPKGDAFVTARLAGVAAAKRTAELIPLCHPLPLDQVDVEIEPDVEAGSVLIRATVRATARTGVEMEALTAATIAAVTLYDMAKGMQRDISIESVRVVAKEGGRSGSWVARDAPQLQPTRAAEHEAVVITASTRAATGERDDTSGPRVVSALAEAGFDVVPEPLVLPDDHARLVATLAELADAGHRLIVTTGGTGLTPNDVTPAATRAVIDREVPGLAELMRSAGIASTPMAALSRAVVGSRGTTLIVNLPGSPGGAVESLTALLPVLRHAIDQLSGGDH